MLQVKCEFGGGFLCLRFPESTLFSVVFVRLIQGILHSSVDWRSGYGGGAADYDAFEAIQWVRNVLPGLVRKVDASVGEGFWFGRYTVLVSATYGDNGEKLSATRTIWWCRGASFGPGRSWRWCSWCLPSSRESALLRPSMC